MAKATAAEFASAMGEETTEVWDEERKAEDMFASPTIPDGTYTTTLTAVDCGVDKNKKPFVIFVFIITEPEEHEGVQLRQSHNISVQGKRTIELSLRFMFIEDVILPRMPVTTTSSIAALSWATAGVIAAAPRAKATPLANAVLLKFCFFMRGSPDLVMRILLSA